MTGIERHGAVSAPADLQTDLRYPSAHDDGHEDFPREYKYTFGQKLKDELIELVVMIYRANSATDKNQHIQSILERVQAIQLLMRLSHDMRILARRHYAALSEMTDSLARQAQGWLRSSGKGKSERVSG